MESEGPEPEPRTSLLGFKRTGWDRRSWENTYSLSEKQWPPNLVSCQRSFLPTFENLKLLAPEKRSKKSFTNYWYTIRPCTSHPVHGDHARSELNARCSHFKESPFKVQCDWTERIWRRFLGNKNETLPVLWCLWVESNHSWEGWKMNGDSAEKRLVIFLSWKWLWKGL